MKLFLVIFLLILWMSSVYAQIPLPTPPPAPYDVRVPVAGGGSPTKKLSPPTAGCIEPPSELEIAPLPLEQYIDFMDWLNAMTQLNGMTHERRRLLRIIPVRNTRSLFMFTEEKSGTSFPYWVKKVDDAPDPYAVKAEIHANEGKTFLGIHRLAENSYLMVFYEKQ